MRSVSQCIPGRNRSAANGGNAATLRVGVVLVNLFVAGDVPNTKLLH